MRILTNDIGGLTQDILLFDTTQTIENCLKMIMPSPTSNLARKIRTATSSKRDIFFTGLNMGGGPSKKALLSHLEAGFKAYATASAAATFDDDLEQVKQMGVKVIRQEEAPSDVEVIETKDLDLIAMEKALAAFEVDASLDAIAVAVLDHGAAPPGVSDRVFRFQHLKETILKTGNLLDFAYLADGIPEHLTRMKSVAQTELHRDIPLLVMDTPIAAAIGAMEDAEVSKHRHKVIVNAGNFHTLAFHLNNDSIMGFFEHHTRLLDTEKIDILITKMISGELTNEEVYNDNGHGSLIIERASDVPFVTVTGPQRHLMNNSKFIPHFAAPYGDMMLTGCFGLVRAFAHKEERYRGVIEKSLET